MPKCEGCGVELLEGTVFCPYCGAQVKKDEPANPEFVEVEKEQEQAEFGDQVLNTYVPKKESGAFKVFSILGMVFGIIVLCFVGLTILTMDTPVVGLYLSAFALEFSVPGLIFSCIGKKSVRYHGKAVFGFVANLVCLILSFILLFVCAFAFIAQGGSPEDVTGGFYF